MVRKLITAQICKKYYKSVSTWERKSNLETPRFEFHKISPYATSLRFYKGDGKVTFTRALLMLGMGIFDECGNALER